MPDPIATDDATSNSSSQNDWNKFDALLKRNAIIAIVAASLAFPLIFGFEALYIVIGIGAVATFAIYPEIDPEWVLWGGTIGGLCIGSIAIIPGAVLGYYLNQKYHQFVTKIESLNTAVNSVKSGIDTVTSVPSSLKSKFSKMMNNFTSLFRRSSPSDNSPEQDPTDATPTLNPQTTPILHQETQAPILHQETQAPILHQEAMERIMLSFSASPTSQEALPPQQRRSRQVPILIRKAVESEPTTKSTPYPGEVISRRLRVQ